MKRILSALISVMLLVGVLCIPSVAAAGNPYEDAAKLLDQKAYTDSDLGVLYTPGSTRFTVWAPTASKVELKLYEKGSKKEGGASEQPLSTTAMTFNSENGTWSLSLNGDYKNKYYTYNVTVNSVTNEVVDIYAKAVGVDGNRGMICDLDSTDPEGWEDDSYILLPSQTDAVVWELQIKDFSYNENSGVSAKNRGKYLAFTETGTTLNNQGSVKTCVDYLKDLGITHVQINPFYDFNSINEDVNATTDTAFNWGYDPKNYNAPEGSFSSNPYDGNVRINETKQMIKALHDAGIGVIMDVVYNHTGENNSWFQKTVPNYYYRINANGTWSNGSGCGNDTASERAMYRKFMVDSVTYWAKEYHVDGFRFDLMGLHDTTTMNAIRSSLDANVDPKIIMYGEAWTMTTTADTDTVLATQANASQLNERVACFNDSVRDAIKGSVFDQKGKGFIQGNNTTVENIKKGVQANVVSGGAWKAKAPTQTVTYDSCHDNATLYDRLVYSMKPAGSDFRARYEDLVAMNKLAGATVLTSQGISFILAGEEMSRSKDGNENSYNASATLNMIDWSNLIKYSDVVSYYSGLMDIRSSFSAFRDPTTATANAVNFATGTPTGTVGFTMDNVAGAVGEWSKIAAVYNNNTTAQEVTLTGAALPEAWVVVANDKAAGVKKLSEVTGNTITVPALSAVILVDKTSFDAANIQSTKGTVIIKHVDKASGDVLSQSILTGTIGTNYVTAADDNLALEYDLATTPANATGAYTDHDITVTYEYTAYTGTFGTVTTKFMCGDKEVAPAVTTRARTGANYTTASVSVLYYSLDQTKLPANASGKYSNSEIIVTYEYTESKTSVTVHVRMHDSSTWTPNLYAWYEEAPEPAVNFLGGWPGKKMNLEKGKWYSLTFDFDGYYNFIVNGSGQTADLKNYTGEVWAVLNANVLNKSTSEITVYTSMPDIYKSEVLDTRMLGDVNNDKTVSLKDATLIQKYLAKIATLTADDLKVADVNKDGNVTLKDVTKLQRYLAKIDTEL